MDKKILTRIIARLARLERKVFGYNRQPVDSKLKDAKKYKGATGGIRLLLDENFFAKKRFFHEVCKALESKGYHYSKQAVQTPLKNLSSSKGKVLVALTEKGRKLYAKRK